MKKVLLSIILLFYCFTANAGTIIAYESKKDGNVILNTYNTDQISIVRYVEEAKVLRIFVNLGEDVRKYDFIVSSAKEALDIINKIYDKSNSSLIELDYE